MKDRTKDKIVESACAMVVVAGYCAFFGVILHCSGGKEERRIDALERIADSLERLEKR